MKRSLFTLAMAATVLTSTTAKEIAPNMPVVSGEDLNGKRWVAPADFPAARTLVVIGFAENQQTAIDAWINGMGATKPASKIAWIEMPVIENPGIFMRWFVNTGMRGGIPDPKIRAHVWTAYTDRKAFMKSSGLTSEKNVYALVIDRRGHILASEQGPFTRDGSRRLLKALEK